MNWLQTYGTTLVTRGWNILPLKPASKMPAVREWQKLHPDPYQVDKWIAKGFARYSIGILTRDTPAVDLDIYDERVAADMTRIVQEIVGPTLVRVGRPPKALLVYRCDEPFDKQVSATYEDDWGYTHRVEILGSGQQFAAMGIHPDTAKPYTWSTPLDETYPIDLPVIDMGQVREILESFEGLALRHQWRLVTNAKERSPLDDETLRLMRLMPKPENVDVPQLLRTLVADATERDAWLRVGMALHHQYEGSDEGLDLWDAWSQNTTENNYSLVSVYQAWQSFQSDIRTQKRALVTMRSMIKRAHEIEKGLAVAEYAKKTANGHAEANGTSHAETNGSHVEPPPVDTRSSLQGWLERYVYVVQGNLVHDLQRPANDADIDFHSFVNLTKNAFIPVADEKGELKAKPLMQIWLGHPGRLNAERSIYEPAEPRLIKKGPWNFINAFWLPEHVADQGWQQDDPRFRVFNEHMLYLIPDEREREWFISWMAFTVSKPEVRSKVTPLHISLPHGTGRGWIHELFGKMLGAWNCKKTSMAVFSGDSSAGQFQDYMHRSLVCSIEEVKDGGKRFGIDDRVRDKLEANRLEVNLKFGAKDTINVYTNFFLMSNHTDALVISREDRRIQVISGPRDLQPLDYYKRLYAWLEGSGPAQLYHTLCRRDLEHFNWQRSYATDARERMIQSATTDTESAFLDWARDQPEGRKVSYNRILAELALAPYELIDANEKMIAHLIRDWAYKSDKRETFDGERCQPWIIRKRAL